MRDATSKVDWNRLVVQLPHNLSSRFELLLRRALRRRLQGLELGGADVPPVVRTQAVGLYRRRCMQGASKAARRRMTYERLKANPAYLAIEREELAKYLKRHPQPGREAVDVDAMSLAEACAAYRDTRPTLAGSSLEQFARETYRAAARQSAAHKDVVADLARYVLSVVRKQDVSNCASVYALGPRVTGQPRKQGFHVQDLTTPEAVATRVRASHLVDGVLARAYGGGGTADVVLRLLVGRLRRQPSVVALDRLMTALFGPAYDGDAAGSSVLRREVSEAVRLLHGREFTAQVADELLHNPRYRQQFDRAVELKLRVRQNVPETPMEAYPLARTMRRRFVLHVGPTNSGKTHDALRALMAAESGAYLGPLRLLAYEQFELMNREGCPCTLLTGEELAEVAGARHVSSTVEMANFHTPVEVAVIDEAQMVADPDRGHHWTAAILGMPAQEVHVCCAPYGARVVRRLVELCGDEHVTVQHERLVPLKAERGSFSFPADVQPGDALIVFSRRAVHAVAAQVAACGMKPSLVYGALPHDVRHEEARRFDSGETDVVVATDAIGMGMNLPIRRIVFVEQQKFDGHEMRMLKPEEVQQIAGRAGRFGRYDVGLYRTTKLRREIKERYEREVPAIASIPVGIPEDIALVRDATLTESILQWMSIEQPSPFVRIDVSRDLALIGEVERRLDPEARTEIATKQLVLALATMAFDERDALLLRTWRQMVEAELAGHEAELPLPEPPQAGRRLADLEEDYRYCDLLYSYARAFDHPTNKELLSALRTQISHAIMDLLAQASEKVGRAELT